MRAAGRNPRRKPHSRSQVRQEEAEVSVCIKKSPAGSVVIVRGWSFVTRSNLMTHAEAVKLAVRLSFKGRVA